MTDHSFVRQKIGNEEKQEVIDEMLIRSLDFDYDFTMI